MGPGTSSLELTAVLPDGGVRPLLWLREHRLDWPSSYVYLDPVPLPRGSRLVMTTYVTNTGDAADQGAAPAAPDPRPDEREHFLRQAMATRRDFLARLAAGGAAAAGGATGDRARRRGAAAAA